MAIRYWDPAADLLQAHRDMDRLFDQFVGYGGTPGPAGTSGQLPTFTLPVDILENDRAYMIMASVPGFDPEKVDVTYQDGVINIVAQAEPLEVTGQWLRQERPYGSLVRRLEFPTQVAYDQIKATFENGLLTVTVPKAARPEPVKIPVGGAKQLGAKSEKSEKSEKAEKAEKK